MSDLDKQPSVSLKGQKPSLYVILIHRLEDLVDEINWIHIAFKVCAFSYIGFIAWITWHVLPIPGHWDIGRQSDKVPPVYQDLNNYFGSFNGFSECNVRAVDLYGDHHRDEYGRYAQNVFCPNRKTLLQAMSDGGRIGFDAPYNPRYCRYRWYTVTEICMILDRFERLVFIGDDSLQSVYNGLNIILRQDLASGSLRTWSMDSNTRAECSCDNQFVKPSCAQYFITDSEQTSKAMGGTGGDLESSYVCKRTPHDFLHVDASGLTPAHADRFNQLVTRAPPSNYKPIPIVHALSPAIASQQEATDSLLHILKLADVSQRKTPILWLGPSAAGHIEVKGRKGNQQIWDFDRNMASVARDKDVEVLGMWNMTVQASSWDGVRFGEKVALVQAMMVINWLARLESS